MDPKNVIRDEVQALMKALAPKERSAASPMLAERVRRVVDDRNARCVMGFLADQREINFDSALAELLSDPEVTDSVPIVVFR